MTRIFHRLIFGFLRRPTVPGMTTSHGGPGAANVKLRSWPQLGDLALDTAQDDRVGVIVGVPGEEGSNWLTYHLQPVGGGPEWSALADASTLQPVPSSATHDPTHEGPVRHPGAFSTSFPCAGVARSTTSSSA